VTAAGAGALWSPNHKYVSTSLEACGISIVDQCQGPISLGAASAAITCVTSDEVENGEGDGNTTEDMIIDSATTVRLRAERSGVGDGRVYNIHFRVTDAAGNPAHGVCQVTVPHDMSPPVGAIDSGAKYTVGTCL
jgi:hypothetical protein